MFIKYTLFSLCATPVCLIYILSLPRINYDIN